MGFVQLAGVSVGTPCSIQHNTTQGNVLVALVAAKVGSGSPNMLSSLSDSKGNSWTVDLGGGTSTPGVAIGHCTLATALTTTTPDTVTATLGSGTTLGTIMLIELSGLSQAAPDKTSTNGPFFSASDSTGTTGTLSQASEIALSWAAGANSGTTTWTKPGGWTEIPSGLTVNMFDAAWLTVNSTAALDPTWTQGTSTNMIAGIATYKLIVPSPPPTTHQSIVPQIRSSWFFSRVPWHENLGGLLIPSDAERRLIVAR